MSDEKINETQENEESFADMFESYSGDVKPDIRIGDKISGDIISIGADNVFVNTGTKIDGVVEKEELLDDNKEFHHKVGDVLELYVVGMDEDEIKLSKAISGIGGFNMLKEAYENKIPVEGKVKGMIKGGFHIEILNRRTFCPLGQIDLKYVEKPEEYLNSTQRFLITRFEENGRNIVVSRKALLEKELEKSKKEFFAQVKPGDTLEGKVVKLMPYGVFVEIFPGVEGMVHISEISWSRIESPEEALKEGDRVEVQLIGIEKDKKNKQEKIELSIKQLSQDPWETVANDYTVGNKIKGRVTNLMPFGAFVEIGPGVEGLVHISEMSYKERIHKPEDVVQIGQEVEVVIKDIDQENKRISLSIRDVEGDPWFDVPEKYTVGQVIEGILEKKEKFGYFVNLEPGVTGLLPISKIKKSSQMSSIEKIKPGESISVVIEEIKPQAQKITLGAGSADEEDDWKTYTKPDRSSMGTFGEKLQQAFDQKRKK